MAYPVVFPHRRELAASASGTTGNTGKTMVVDIEVNDAIPTLHFRDYPEFELGLTPEVRTFLGTLLADLTLGD